MRTLVLLVVLASLVIPLTNSYAQSAQPNMAIYVQIKVQDSSGNLISYLETDRVTVLDPLKLNKMLDENSGTFQKSIISVGGQQYQLIKASNVRVHSSATIVSSEIISVQNGNAIEQLVYATHDGYPVVKGDKVTVYWTILRPAS